MLATNIQATIYFSHSPEETKELAAAVVPMTENIRAVGTQSERAKMRAILSGDTFRYRDAKSVTTMLLRAANHARANLTNYFPMLHQEILGNAERLENAARNYWATFKAEERELIPTP